MAKVLKVAASIVGITALAFTGLGFAAGLPLIGAAGTTATAFGLGVSASTLFLVSGGLALGSSLLAGNKAPAASPSDRDRLFANIDPRTPRKHVFGGPYAMTCEVRPE